MTGSDLIWAGLKNEGVVERADIAVEDEGIGSEKSGDTDVDSDIPEK